MYFFTLLPITNWIRFESDRAWRNNRWRRNAGTYKKFI